MITYRAATVADTESIARLHSLSWQQNYKGIWSDAFLSGEVLADRLAVWSSRLEKPDENQYVVVAEDNTGIRGFACAYLDHDPVWGTLLDNLHVHRAVKGQGIGTRLMQLAARWSCHHRPESGFYLWVLEQNSPARRFYEQLGATNYEQVSSANPGGGYSPVCRYIWTDLTRLIGHYDSVL